MDNKKLSITDEDFEPVDEVLEKDVLPSNSINIENFFDDNKENTIDDFFEYTSDEEVVNNDSKLEINEEKLETPILEDEKPDTIINMESDNKIEENNMFDQIIENEEVQVSEVKEEVKIPILEEEKTDTIINIEPDNKAEENFISSDQIMNSELNKETNIKIDENMFSNNYNKKEQEENILNINPDLVTKTDNNFFKKYAVLLPLFAFFFTSFLGIYLFSVNSDAKEINLIKIEENGKYGYIDSQGNVIIRPKYLYGTDFYKGYSIVKNQNSLSAVINGKGVLETGFGNYFYIERYNNRYIVSKFTSNGLKLALLDSNLNEITKYKYDNITYSKNNTFLFTRNDTMGVLNKYGKEIYTYTVDEVDDKNISIEVSKVDSNKLNDKYAKIKINNSSTIINLSTGQEVYKYTLDDINVLDNNVFYIENKKDDDNSKYIIIRDDKIAYQTQNYKRVRVDNFKSNIAIGVKDNAKLDYINLKTKKIINDNENITYQYGDGLILERTHNFNKDIDVYNIFTSNKKIGTFNNLKPVTGEFSNDFLMINVDNDKYNYVNKHGNILNDDYYDTADDFDKFGYAIVSKDNNYGVINRHGNISVKLKYEKIEKLDEDLFKSLKQKYDKELFIYYKNGKCGLIDSKGKIIVNSIYDSFEYITLNYPIIAGVYEKEKRMINIKSGKEIGLNYKKNVSIYENYIIIKKEYYNYDGKLIYGINQEV